MDKSTTYEVNSNLQDSIITVKKRLKLSSNGAALRRSVVALEWLCNQMDADGYVYVRDRDSNALVPLLIKD